MSKRNRFQMVVGGVFGGLMIVVALVQYRAANKTSLESAAQLAADSYVRSLEALREVYTSEVVNRLPDSVLVTHDYEEYPQAVPLPATLTRTLAENLGDAVEGLEVRLYSEYPFPYGNTQPMDDFERRAFDFLSEEPDSMYLEVIGPDNADTLRFARGDRMRAECVECHNTHPDSPKRDWEEGDLRGVLEVSFPLTSLEARAREARQPYSMLLLLALIGLLGAFVMLVDQLPDLPAMPRFGFTKRNKPEE